MRGKTFVLTTKSECVVAAEWHFEISLGIAVDRNGASLDRFGHTVRKTQVLDIRLNRHQSRLKAVITKAERQQRVEVVGIPQMQAT